MASCNGKLGVIFDFDGVLVDSGWAHRQAWYDLAEAEGLAMSDAFFSATFGMQNDTILPMLYPGITKGEIERLSDWKEQRYRDLVRSRPEPAEGAMALLGDLKAKGFKVAIGSSAPRANVEVFREALQLDHHIDARVTKEQVTEGKPSPRTFLKAAEALSLPPGRCAVVEDAVHGVEAGKAGGMPVVAVTTTRTREELSLADRVVDSLAELEAEDFLMLLGRKT
ncbi:MAG: HAD family hydrolase [Planctomycetota bacterium]|jgi:HAD superfamily hydrolase (TIGR01509 family)